MAGHSKWSTIKRKKGALDAQRSKMFSKAIREINAAIKEGGSNDPDSNAALRNAIANARGLNMPKDNIERALKKGGEGQDNYERVSFEGYGPFGVAFFIECTTNNINRTVANVRAIFNKCDGNLGKNGEVEFLFEHKGVFIIEKESITQNLEELEFTLIESGLESMEVEEDFIEIHTAYTDFGNMSKSLEELNIEVKNAKLERIPLNTISLPLEQAQKILDMEERFEDDDDVQNVFHTLELTDELMAELEG